MAQIKVCDEQWEMRELPKLNTITIAKVGYLPHADVYPEVDGNPLTDKGRARARMMAAAPRMLRALRMARDELEGGMDPGVVAALQEVEAAISEAEG